MSKIKTRRNPSSPKPFFSHQKLDRFTESKEMEAQSLKMCSNIVDAHVLGMKTPAETISKRCK